MPVEVKQKLASLNTPIEPAGDTGGRKLRLSGEGGSPADQVDAGGAQRLDSASGSGVGGATSTGQGQRQGDRAKVEAGIKGGSSGIGLGCDPD